jgi:hypothetical protein
MGHLTKWLFFNLGFGAIPYALVVALNRLQTPGVPLLHPSSEMLFIALASTSSALAELWDGEDHWHPARVERTHWQMVLLLGVLSSSLLYGAYTYHSFMSPGRAVAVDCTAVASLLSQQRTVLGGSVDWTRVCLPWMRVQTGFFRWSLWLTALCVIVSTTAVHRCRPRWR